MKLTQSVYITIAELRRIREQVSKGQLCVLHVHPDSAAALQEAAKGQEDGFTRDELVTVFDTAISNLERQAS